MPLPSEVKDAIIPIKYGAICCVRETGRAPYYLIVIQQAKWFEFPFDRKDIVVIAENIRKKGLDNTEFYAAFYNADAQVGKWFWFHITPIASSQEQPTT